MSFLYKKGRVSHVCQVRKGIEVCGYVLTERLEGADSRERKEGVYQHSGGLFAIHGSVVAGHGA